MKEFRSDLTHLHTKMLNGENFAFTRYSDGEMFIMQGKRLRLSADESIVGDQRYHAAWAPEDHKDVDPVAHRQIVDKLIASFKYDAPEYYKGISCKCCVGHENRMFFDTLCAETKYWTWANLLVNGNYPYFLDHILPLILAHPKLVLIANGSANLHPTVKPVKWFKVGTNCIVNDQPLIEEMTQWVQESQITNHLFIFSASSLTQMLIHRLHQVNPQNTYINVGTTMNHLLGLTCNRGYLHIHKGETHDDMRKICIW
jgi:hypothetical protein